MESDSVVQSARLPVEHWARLVYSPDRAEQQGALGMLGRYGDEAVPYIPAIGRFLESPNDSLGFTAAWSLAHIGLPAAEALAHRLTHRNGPIRRRAAYGLGEMGPDATATVPQLRQLADSDPVLEVRYMAQWAVDRIVEGSMVADPRMLLTEGLASEDLAARLTAIRRLGATHPSNRIAVNELIRTLDDSSSRIRNAAIDALVAKGSSAFPSLMTALQSRRPLVRNGAMIAVTRLHRGF